MESTFLANSPDGSETAYETLTWDVDPVKPKVLTLDQETSGLSFF